jgi:hypothetical protein
MFDAVDNLIRDSGPWLGELLDVDIFKRASMVEQAIVSGIRQHFLRFVIIALLCLLILLPSFMHAGDMALILQWCGDHASKLRRLNSILEFLVRQEQVSTHLRPLFTSLPKLIYYVASSS